MMGVKKGFSFLIREIIFMEQTAKPFFNLTKDANKGN
jgi:hypothetical protein